MKEVRRSIIMKIDPTLAAEWLKKNASNRSLRRRHVNRLALAMKAGHWRENSVPIIFDWDGNLLDGQHRLNAIIRSGVTITSTVTYGMDPGVYKTIDAGCVKKLTDLSPRKDGYHVHAAAKFIHLYESGYQMHLRTVFLPVEIVDDIIDANPTLVLPEYIALARLVSKSYRGSGLTCSMLIFFLAATENESATSTEFLGKLQDGIVTSAGDPVAALARVLRSHMASKMRSPGESVVLALLVKAWNATMMRRKIQLLRFLPDEDFPTIIGSHLVRGEIRAVDEAEVEA